MKLKIIKANNILELEHYEGIYKSKDCKTTFQSKPTPWVNHRSKPTFKDGN